MEQYPGVFLERYAAHRAEIGARFFDGRDPGEIITASGVGDRHLHGASVLRVGTEAGELYYKPRDCSCTDFLSELNTALFGERMTPEQISGRGYAFQKALTPEIPAEGAPRTTYYQRLGRLLAVFYALGSTDMHRGNVLAVGEHPVTVDTETLLCGRAPGIGGTGEFSVDYGDIFPEYRASVGECMVLPRFYSLRQNSPMLLKGCDPTDYADAFLGGFLEGYRRLAERRDFIFDLLDRYRDMPFRYVMRSTRGYNAIIRAYFNAAGSAEREEALRRLDRGLSGDELIRWRPVLEWERESIREGDVPYFWFRAGETALRGDVDGGVLIPDFFRTSPAENAKERMRRMGEQDLAVQSAYIRGSLRHIDGWENRIAKYLKPTLKAPDILPAPLAPEAALAEATEALRMLWDERIPLSEKRVLWHVPLISGKVGSMFGIGDGFSGVAVFCAALASSPLLKSEDTELARNLSAACFNDLTAFGQYLLNEYPTPPEEQTLRRRLEGGFGFSDGLAGYLWALGRCGGEDAQFAARLLEGFRTWNLPKCLETELAELERAAQQPWSGTDTLENGVARRAAAALLRQDTKQAGRLLAWAAERKLERGVYTAFPAGRKQYFFPAFLRGSLGVAYVMLRYAEACGEYPINGRRAPREG